MCGINLIWWRILSSDFQGIYSNRLSDPPMNLLNISVLYSYYFPLTPTQDSTRTAYMTPKTIIMMIKKWIISMSKIQYPVQIRILWMTESPMSKRRSWRRPGSNEWS